jgi:hypothetical protein
MRHIILKDKKIQGEELAQWMKEDVVFWEKNVGVTPTYEVIEQDYTDYPTYVDQDGDIRPTHTYLKSLNDLAVKKYGEFGFDFLMVMVHEDNWKSDTDHTKGIWGTNYSYVFGKQCLDYCRWDRDRLANTFGTAYHERHHSFDAIVKVETGVDVQPLLNVAKYDHEITHGNNPRWKYIRYKENLDSLSIMAPHLVKAFAKRKERHKEVMGMMETIINLATQVIYLLKARQARKDGVPRN